MIAQASPPRALTLAPYAWAASLLFASSAAAHGGPPVIENALAADDSGPFLIELSEGFALRSGDSWSFICPALFGDELPPPTTTLGDEGLFAGARDLVALGASRAAIATGHPDLAGSRVLSMAVLDGDLLALRLRAADADGKPGSEIVRVHDDSVATLFESPEYWSSLIALPASGGTEAKIWIVRDASEGLVVAELAADGTELDQRSAAFPLDPLNMRLSVAGKHVFAHVTENGSYTLLHIATHGEPAFDPKLIATAALPFAGPALRGDEILLSRDSELLRWKPEGAERSDSPLAREPLTCLTPEHVCTASGRIYDAEAVELAGSYEESPALFDLAQLQPPQLLPESEEDKARCDLQWIVFRTDLVRVGILHNGGTGGMSATDVTDAGADGGTVEVPDAMRSPPARQADGCAVRGPTASHACGLMGFACLALCVRRTRVKRSR